VGEQGPSIAMGYAFQVTPLQLAAAYAAIANDGILLMPSVVREVRGPDGEVLYRHQPTVVRRVISTEVAARLRGFLALSASDTGTGGRAQVKGGVLGKTGTARLVENRRYVDRRAASFAGIFPARDPQLVVTVRVEDPKGAYYGGLVAAPMVGRMLRQALAARRTALDRVRLADERIAATRPNVSAPEERRERSHVAIPIGPEPPRARTLALVPDVVGRSVRAAAAALHRRGFRVKLDGTGGVVTATIPAQGDSLALGKTVTVSAGKEAPR
jgi:cell division protein FtsI (penicillin-binding protein 3)